MRKPRRMLQRKRLQELLGRHEPRSIRSQALQKMKRSEVLRFGPAALVCLLAFGWGCGNNFVYFGASNGAGGAGGSPTNQATGGGSQGANPECGSASDCATPVAICATASCNNGVCEEVPGNVGTSCRAAVSNCDVEDVCDGKSAQCPDDSFVAAGTNCRLSMSSCDLSEVCDGVSANCAPDTGPVAACQVNLPITYANLERTFTITSVNLAGTGKTVATVSPGSQVTLKVGGSWQRVSSPTCASCLTQFYFAMQGAFQDCGDVSSPSGMINRSISFTAPQAPGVYFVNLAATWDYKCVTVMVPTTFTQSTVATLVVQ